MFEYCLVLRETLWHRRELSPSWSLRKWCTLWSSKRSWKLWGTRKSWDACLKSCLPWVFVSDTPEAEIRAETPDDVDYHKAQREIAERRTLLSVVPKGPKDFAALYCHVDLDSGRLTVRYPLTAWRICIFVSCSASKASWSLGTVGSTNPLFMMKGLFDINTLFELQNIRKQSLKPALKPALLITYSGLPLLHRHSPHPWSLQYSNSSFSESRFWEWSQSKGILHKNPSFWESKFLTVHWRTRTARLHHHLAQKDEPDWLKSLLSLSQFHYHLLLSLPHCCPCHK